MTMRTRGRKWVVRIAVLQGQLQAFGRVEPSIVDVRRTPLAGLAPALLAVLVLTASASASPVLTLRSGGGTFVREDRFLPADVGLGAPPGSSPVMRRHAGLRAAPATPQPTVSGELDRMLASAEIDQPAHDRYAAIWAHALALRKKLHGARRAAMSAVLHNTAQIAATGQLIASRLPATFETVARNRQWWAGGPLLRDHQRVGFASSRLVWQYYAGEGLQIQWLGTFGRANGYWQGGTYDTQLREILDEALGMAAQRAGGLAWEYLFDFDGGAPPWVSGLAQGTALQAYSRAAVRLAKPDYFQVARAGLGIFREAPPSGVRVATPAGAHYLIYSFAPGLRVLNAFTQALNGLDDFAALANDAEGRALFAAGESQLRTELALYDTGAWSRYSLHREADLSYHKLARDFLRNLCTRLTDEAARAPAPAPAPVAGAAPTGGTPLAPEPTGGTPPVAPPPAAPVPDPAPYCGAAGRWTTYLNRAPKLQLASKRVRGGHAAAVRIELDKPSFVTVAIRRAGRTVAVLGARFASGRHALLWRHPPRGGGIFTVHLSAQDLAGNVGSSGAKLRVLRAKR
jgi:hypothetical protein